MLTVGVEPAASKAVSSLRPEDRPLQLKDEPKADASSDSQGSVAALAVVSAPDTQQTSQISSDEKKRRMKYINAAIANNATVMKPSSAIVVLAAPSKPGKPAVGQVIMEMVGERSEDAKRKRIFEEPTQKRILEEPTLKIAKQTCAKAAQPTPFKAARPTLAKAAAKKTPAAISLVVAAPVKRTIEWTPTVLPDGAVRRRPAAHYTDYPSRSEVVLRSGYRGSGQSKTLSWGKKASIFGTHDDVLVAAAHWVQRNNP